MRRRRSLASQLLVWQLVVVTLLLCAVGALTVVQLGSNFRSNEERRMLSVAETVAATNLVQTRMGNWQLLAAPAETARSLSGASYVLIVDRRRIVIASPDPNQIGSTLDTPTTALDGKAWNDQEARRAFSTISRLILPGNPEQSRFLLKPLHPDGGGSYTHNGPRRWQSRQDPEWQMLAGWVRGERKGNTCS